MTMDRYYIFLQDNNDECLTSTIDPSTILACILLWDKSPALWFLMFAMAKVYLCKGFQRKVYLDPLKDQQQSSFLEAGKEPTTNILWVSGLIHDT